jgi:DNA processing protein
MATLEHTLRRLRPAGLPKAEIEAGIAADLRWLEGAGRTLLTLDSPDYPELLARIASPPPALFVEGAVGALALPQLAIVGSRNPTALGRETATRFATQLAGAGLAITSGLALGIDAAAHRGALAAGRPTVAVLGGGLDCIYPAEHTGLAATIPAGGGALVSEFPTGTPPLRNHFPRRNRIIAGLAVGTLVVEAALRSGSLITARLAAEQGREVFAIPGSIHSPTARGCHHLIRDGAKLVETADDVLAELAPLLGTLHRNAPPTAPPPTARPAQIIESTGPSAPPLDKDQEILLDAVGFEPASVDALTARLGWKAGTVASMLLILELEGLVAQQPGGIFSRRLAGKGP